MDGKSTMAVLRRIGATCMSLAAAAVVLTGSAKAQSVDKRFLGAWTAAVADCPNIFEKKGGQVRFKEPRDQFNFAFLVTPTEVKASGGDCRIAKAKTEGDITKLTLMCTNSVSTDEQDALVKILSDNKVSYSANGDPDLSSTYEKCAF